MKNTIIPRFAANIKRGLNKAYERDYIPGSRVMADEQKSRNFQNNGEGNGREHPNGISEGFLNNNRKDLEDNIKAEIIRRITVALS